MPPDGLSAAAAGSVWVSRMAAFTGWVGAGRKHPATGRVTLVHARELVELLGTGDVVDPSISGEVRRTKSSEELPHLNAVVEWAKASRLVRVTNARLTVVKKNAALLQRPLPLWQQMFEAFGKLGSALCPPGWGESLLRRHFGDGIGAVLAGLHARGGRVQVEQVCAWAWEAVATGYQMTEVQRATLRKCNDRDVRRALGVLDQLGAVRLDGADAGQTVELTALGRWAMARRLGEPEPGEPILQIKVTLLETAAPEVWRRLLVPAGIRLDRLHRVVQVAMGWQNYHLHSFTDGATTYGRADPELDFTDERAVSLVELVKGEGDRLGYSYDFGDGWEHEILVEKATVAEPDLRYPVCSAGEGACPPEDCGGPWGYQELREVLADPSNDEHERMLGWLGLANAADFDPTRFDLDRTNQAIVTSASR
jgi:hypothetical protein